MTFEGSSQGPDAPPPPPPASPPSAEPAAPQPPAGGSDNRTLMIVLSYLGILCLIPLLIEKEDKDVQWHAKHGLVLTVAEIIFFVVMWIISAVLTAILAPLGCIFGLLIMACSIGVLVLHIMCIAKGLKGERLKVPGVSDFTEKF